MIPELAICIAIGSAIVSYLIQFDLIKIIGVSKYSGVVGCVTVAVIMFFIMMANSTKHFATLSSYLFSGEIKNVEVLVEGDEETKEHLATKYYFDYDKPSDKDYKDLIEWVVLISFFIPLYITGINLKRSADKDGKNKPRNHYT
jgi:hypothetical protein